MEEFLELTVMWNAGIIGNLGIMQTLGQQVAMKANQYLPKGSPPYQLKDFIPNTVPFLDPPQTKEEKKAALHRGLALVGGIPPEMAMKYILDKQHGN